MPNLIILYFYEIFFLYYYWGNNQISYFENKMNPNQQTKKKVFHIKINTF